MNIQQPELPKDTPATGNEQFGFSFWEFLDDNKYYLLIILFILGIFFYSRSYFNKHK